MKKKNLLLSQIKVKSFITELEEKKSATANGGARGTVHSDNEPTCDIVLPAWTRVICPSKPTACKTTVNKLCGGC